MVNTVSFDSFGSFDSFDSSDIMKGDTEVGTKT
jgi:hypothetical protein